ncbi:adenylyl cyclase [Sphingomonas oryzagri]
MASRTSRRRFIGQIGGAAAALGVSPLIAKATAARDPDFGPNVLLIDPSMPREAVQQRIDAIFRAQETAQFGDERYAILFKPGRYAFDVNVGFYTQVAGLGRRPGDVRIAGHVHAEADWNHGMALVNFWRGVENLAISPADGMGRWAVSQGAPYRRVDMNGDLVLDDGGWSSGGFLADSHVRGTIRSGTQQQWLTRSSTIGGWEGSNWNMMFVGVEGAPATSFPDPPFTNVPNVPRIREKPFLFVDDAGNWSIFRPALRNEARGPSWVEGAAAGEAIPLSRFLIVQPGTHAAAVSGALSEGRHILFMPGIHRFDETIRVDRPGAVIFGLGLATLVAENGAALMRIGDVPGVTVAGLLFDAGPQLSPVLLQVGGRTGGRGDARDPVLLADLFFRVGGASVGKVNTALEINRDHTIADHLWIWRADHGDRQHGKVHVGWDESTGEYGLVVNGDGVTIYGLFVEHFRRHQVLWNGDRGATYFFQCELPYDPPSQSAWREDDPDGWAAYKVADTVRQHDAIGLGIYANFTVDPGIVLRSAIEAPQRSGVSFTNVTTISLGGGKGIIAHLVNDAGEAARPGADRQTLRHYPIG